MKKFLSFLLTVFILFSCCACSLSSDEKDAVTVIKTFIQAVEENDTETQEECMDPSVIAFSKGTVDSLGDLFGISGAYDMANGAMGLLGSLSEQALDIEVECEFKKVLENNISDNDGDVTVECELTVTDNESKEKVKQDISWTFNMVQKDSQWYIQGYDAPQAILSEEEQKEADSINTVGGRASGFDYGKAFSCGVAWVQINNGEEKAMACINKEGIIQFILPDEKPLEDLFYNGVAVVSDNSYVNYRLIDTSGNTVYDFYKENINTDVEFTNTGYSIVEESEETYKGTIKKEGLLDNNGEWVIPLQENTYINYRNDGKFVVVVYADDNSVIEEKMYDAKTNEFLDEQTISILNESQGVVGGWYSVISENMIYMETGILEKERGFYDLEGNMVIDLNEYDYIKGNPYFINGYTCFSTNNFTIIIDKNGEMVCEPIKGNLTDYCYENMENAQLISVLNEGTVSYYDYSGNLVLESDWSEMGAISDGLICVGDRYVDINGNTVIE